MENTEFILEKTASGQVAQKIVNPTINVGFNNGMIQIGGALTVTTITEREQIVALPYDQYSIGITELAAVPQNLYISEDAQAALAAKKAIFQTLFDKVKAATEEATVAIFELNNPIK